MPIKSLSGGIRHSSISDLCPTYVHIIQCDINHSTNCIENYQKSTLYQILPRKGSFLLKLSQIQTQLISFVFSSVSDYIYLCNELLTDTYLKIYIQIEYILPTNSIAIKNEECSGKL